MSWFQKFFLIVVFPLCLLGLLELSVRGLHSLGVRLSKPPEELELEMPAWMLGSASKAETFSASELEWMGFFVNGEGFRVRLQPNIKVWFKDTFSWLKALPNSGFTVTSNSLGFRGWKVPEKKPSNSFRILVFGDSSSFGWGVDYEHSYASVLRTVLDQKLPDQKVEVLNFAMPGDSSVFGELILDKYLSQFQADAVILSYGANDSRRVVLPHKVQVDRYSQKARVHKLREWFSEKSAFFRDLEAFTQELLKPEKPVRSQKRTSAVGLKAYKATLASLIEKAKAHGAKKVLLLGVCSPIAYRNAMRVVSERQDVSFVDGQTMLRASIDKLKNDEIDQDEVAVLRSKISKPLRQQALLYVSSDGCHPNKIGHKIIAGEMVEFFLSSENAKNS